MLAGGIRSCKDTVRTVDREASVAAEPAVRVLINTTNQTHQEKKKSLNWAITSIRLSCGHVYGAFSQLMTEVGGWSPLWLLPPQGKWSWVVKKSKLSTRNKPVGSICHRFLPLLLHEVLPWLWSGRGVYHTMKVNQNICSPSTEKVEAGRSRVQGQSQLHSKMKARLGNKNLCVKRADNWTQWNEGASLNSETELGTISLAGRKNHLYLKKKKHLNARCRQQTPDRGRTSLSTPSTPVLARSAHNSVPTQHSMRTPVRATSAIGMLRKTKSLEIPAARP